MFSLLDSVFQAILQDSVVDIVKIVMQSRRRARVLRARGSVPLFMKIIDGRRRYLRACRACADKHQLTYMPSDRGKRRSVTSCELDCAW